MLFTQRKFVVKVFSEMTFDWCIGSIETPPLTLLHRNDLVSFLLFVSSKHLVLFIFYSPLHTCITDKNSCFLTSTKVITISHSFKDNVTLIANSVYSETINFLLLTSGNITLNSTLRLKSLQYKTILSKKRDMFWRLWGPGSHSHTPILYTNE